MVADERRGALGHASWTNNWRSGDVQCRSSKRSAIPGLIAHMIDNYGAAIMRTDPGSALPMLERALATATEIGADTVALGIRA